MKLQIEVSELLEKAGQFVQQGKREQAYQAGLKATSIAPDEPLAWYARSRAAPSAEEQLMCLSRAYSLNPAFPDARDELRAAVQALLKQEPFLAYVLETEELYQVRSGRDLLVTIPKNRVFERPYLKRDPGPLRYAFRWLYISLAALLLGGLGAFLVAPVTVFLALRSRPSLLSAGDRVRSWVVLLLSLAIWLASIPLGLLLLIRLLP